MSPFMQKLSAHKGYKKRCDSENLYKFGLDTFMHFASVGADKAKPWRALLSCH